MKQPGLKNLEKAKTNTNFMHHIAVSNVSRGCRELTTSIISGYPGYP
jgi:hypothetical protein